MKFFNLISSSRILMFMGMVLLSCLVSSAQSFDENSFNRYSEFTENLSPEKLYLQTDREVYCVGDTVWFKGYLRNHSIMSVFPESNYIYVELISALSEANPQSGVEELTDHVRKRVKIKRTEVGFSGYIDIPDKLNSGPATIRAYTWWMRNQPESQFFKKGIRLMNPVKEDYVAKLVNRKELESSHYLDMGVLNPYRKVRTRVKDIDVQFLPESGRYLPDVPSCLAVMVTTDRGTGLSVSGEIRSGSTKLGVFTTNEMGMGKVTITMPSGTRKLNAVVNHPAAKSKSYKVPFPQDNAVVISVETTFSDIRLRTCGSNSAAVKTVIADKDRIALTASYEDGKEYRIPCQELTPGVNNALVLDTDGHVLAQRDFFVYPRENVHAGIWTDKIQYGKKEQVKAGLSLSDEAGVPLSGDFSLSVSDNGWFPISGSQHTLESYHYLGGEFYTPVEEPSRYFDRSTDIDTRIANLDLVMLTHGWKYYDTESMLLGQSKGPTYGREYSQSISGKVIRPLGFDAKNTTIAFMAPSIGYSSIERLDSTGRFIMEGLDFPDKTSFLISTTGDKKRSTMPLIYEEKFPKLGSAALQPNSIEYIPDTEIEAFKNATFPEIYGEGAADAYSIQPSYIIGDAKRNITGISPYPLFSFKPGQLKLYEEIQSYDSFSVLDYMALKIPGVRMNGDVLVSRVGFESSGMAYTPVFKQIIIYLNGMIITGTDYWILSSMTVQDVDAIAILRDADAAKFQYNGNLRPVPVVLIKSKPITKSIANLASVRPLGWQEPARFYMPKYDRKEEMKADKSYKGTAYWNPSIRLNDGTFDFTFWTTEHETPFLVTIEGYTNDGTPISYSQEVNPQDEN